MSKIDVLFSEPNFYAKKEETVFSDAAVTEIRQVIGFEGFHAPDQGAELLVIGAGYDDELISQVAEYKRSAQKYLMYGLPSLRADMYQENVLRAYRAQEAVGIDARDRSRILYAPAYDPFETATALSRLVDREEFTNLYLCPLATKAQALGFTLFYLTECRDRAVSMLYPYCDSHDQRTSQGRSRVWLYTLEIPA